MTQKNQDEKSLFSKDKETIQGTGENQEYDTEDAPEPSVSKTVPLDKKTQPLDADELFRRAQSAYEANNYQEAVRLFRPLAQAGNAEAMVKLGNCYLCGDGVDEDYTQVAYWYQKAADAGNADAMYNLARCYYWGNGVDQDDTQAAYWYQKAADAGDNYAKRQLDEMRRKGLI